MNILPTDDFHRTITDRRNSFTQGFNVPGDQSAARKTNEGILAPVALLATLSYLKGIGAHYSWWAILIVSPLALVGMAFMMGFLWSSSDTWWSRVLFALFGVGGCFQGFSQPNSWGITLVGFAFVLIALFPNNPTSDPE